VEYEKPAISDYGDLVELTATVDHGTLNDQNFGGSFETGCHEGVCS
jgi:hypothetical protein